MEDASPRSLTLRRFSILVFSHLLSVLMALPCVAQQPPNDLQQRKEMLEVQKLELEVAQLKEPHDWLPGWLQSLGAGLITVAIATATSFWAASKARFAALDQSVHEKRLELYPALVETTSPLAIYFPSGRWPEKTLTPGDCNKMGEAMSEWYFGGGGLLLSVAARDSYFKFMRALTRASLAEKLSVPCHPKDAVHLSTAKLNDYRTELGQHSLDNVDGWEFGAVNAIASSQPYEKFRDYVFLQNLSSDLRSKLAEDLRSRLRPS